jgi:hypothetical protein
VQVQFEGELAKALKAAAEDRSALEATFSGRLQAQHTDQERALAQKDAEKERAVAEVNGSWRRQMDEAHTKFAGERARLTAEMRRKLQEADADAQQRLQVSSTTVADAHFGCRSEGATYLDGNWYVCMKAHLRCLSYFTLR